MEYQKIINFLDNTTNQPSKFRTRNWFEMNDESRGVFNDDIADDNNDYKNNIKFKASMIKSRLCDYSDACILVKRTIRVLNTAPDGAVVNSINKKVVFKSCAPLHKRNK